MLHIWQFPLVMRKARPATRARIRSFIPRLETLEDRTLLATLTVSPGGIVPGSFNSIQTAVNTASSGDTILVDPGIYQEQVTIGKNLTLQGNGPGATIYSPTSLTTDAFGLHVLVEINNAATVNISNLTIQGPNPTINDGILVVGGATANVTGSTIADINQGQTNFGVQTGIGIQVGGTTGTAVGQVGQATITDCTVTDYQKGGIVIGRNGSSGTITGSTVTGIGPTTLNAQNGIEISPGAASATVSNNTVSGNEYIGTGPPPAGPDPSTDTQAAGILNFIGSSSIAGNTVVGNDVGIFSQGGAISDNTIQNNPAADVILAQGNATVSNNTIAGSNIGVAVLGFVNDQFGNPVTQNAVGNLIGNNITNNGNTPVGFPGAGILVENQSGATFTAELTANFNRIAGNSVGLNNQTTTTTDAINNWWGSNAGPGGAGSDTVSGPVTFNPWLVLQVTASPTSLLPGAVATVVASLTTNSSGVDTSTLGHVPNGIPVAFTAASGTIAPTTAVTAAGKAVAQFTAGNTPGTATVSATLDHQTSTANITLTPLPPPAQNLASLIQLYVDSFLLGFFLPFAFIPSLSPQWTNLQSQIQSNPWQGTLLGTLVFDAGFSAGLSALQQQLQAPS